MATKKRGERGPGKAQPVVQVRSSGGHFYIPRKVWRDMGVKDGDMLQFLLLSASLEKCSRTEVLCIPC